PFYPNLVDFMSSGPIVALELVADGASMPFYPNLVDFMSSGPIVALELVADGAVQKWRKLIGPTNTF
ncbi:hypothetical protein T484DRAFT_1825291, partial [Baffinella frigidus]